MKKLIIIFGISLALSACGKSPAVKTGSEISDTPEWVQTMGLYKEGEGAIGSSPKSGLGSQVQREDSTLSARNALAQNIDIKVQSAISQTRQRLLEQGVVGASELGTLQTQNAARQLVNQRLKNSRPIKQWKDPESEELYVWVTIEQVDLDRMAGDVHDKIIRKQLKEAGEQHKETIRDTFNEEFEKQFSR